jgi:hypothetical protein
MGKGYKHGAGGASLNFNVKTYPSETELKADKPKVNTIGVITTTTMTSWVFSANEPKEPEVGMVWFSVGKSSNAEFNALKKNALQVCPIGAHQYETGKFGSKTAFCYQDGAWKSLFDGTLFDNGETFDYVTGGWTQFPNLALSATDYKNTGTVTIGETIYLHTPYSKVCAIATTKNKIALTDYSQVEVTVDALGKEGYATPQVNVYVHSANSGAINYLAVASLTSTGKGYLDIASLDGEYYISLGCGYGENATVSKVKLIK